MSKGNTTNILVRPANAKVPDAYLKMFVTGANSGGYAVQTLKDGKPFLVSDRMDVAPELESVQQLLAGYPSSRIMISMSKLEKVSEALLQPFDFTMPNNVNDVLMSFAIDGDYPSLNDADMAEKGLTEEANFSKKIILPNFGKFLKYSEGDLAKFLAELKDPTFVDAIMARIGDRGVFCFLPPSGEEVWLGKNKLGSAYPWGMVSNTLGYTEAVAAKPAETTVKPPAGKGWFNFSSDDTGPKLPVPEEPKKETIVPDAPVPGPLNLPAAEPDTKITAPPAEAQPPVALKTEPPKGVWKTLPRNLSQKDRKNMVKRVTGCGNAMPEGWQNLDWQYFEVAYTPHPGTPLQAKYDKDTPKDMRSSEPPKVLPTKGSDVVTETNTMVLTSDEKSAAETSILKILDRQGKEIPSPLDIQKSEAKYPTFTKQFGITLEAIGNWLPRDKEAFAKENPKAWFHYTLELNRALIEAKAAAPASAPATIEAPSPAPAPVEEPKKAAAGGWNSW